MEPFYRTTFERHRTSLVRSGYFGRYIDADDRQFLEYVQRCGLANGNLPSVGVVLLEELEFWHFPYSVAPGIERRVGRRPRQSETPETAERRKARTNEWHARRIIRENQKAIADAELKRERAEWDAAQKRRKLRDLVSDAEWDAAAPSRASFGATIDRHHVPEWKLEELGIGQTKPKRRKSRQQVIEQAEQMLTLEEKSQQAAERARTVKKKIDAQSEERRKKKFMDLLNRARQRMAAKTAKEAEQLAEVERIRADLERLERERAIEQERQNLERITRAFGLQWNGMVAPTVYTDANSLKLAVMNLLNSTPGQHWNVEAMMRSLGCIDRAFMDKCLIELVRSGRLRKVETVT